MSSSLDQIGPLAKTVIEPETLYNVIKGQDPMDSTTITNATYPATKKFSKTIGIPKKFVESEGVSAEVKKNFAEAVAKQFSGLKVDVDDVKSVVLKSGLNPEKPASWTEENLANFARMLRKKTKAMIIAANKMDRPDSAENFKKIKEEFDYPIVPCFADGELSLRQADKAGLIDYIPGEKTFEIKKELNEKQKSALEEIKKIIEKYGSTGVQEIINQVVFYIMRYVAVFPAGAKMTDSKGNVLPDCFLMREGSTALDFAFRLHTDIGKNFVKAINLKTKQAVGKDYLLKHLDGIEIITR